MDTGEHWAWQESLAVEPAPLQETVLAERVAVPVQHLWALLFKVRRGGRFLFAAFVWFCMCRRQCQTNTCHQES